MSEESTPEVAPKAIDFMSKQLEEFFDSFILVGYWGGKRVRMEFTPTPKDADAIQQHMEDTLVQDFKVYESVKIVRECDG